MSWSNLASRRLLAESDATRLASKMKLYSTQQTMYTTCFGTQTKLQEAGESSTGTKAHERGKGNSTDIPLRIIPRKRDIHLDMGGGLVNAADVATRLNTGGVMECDLPLLTPSLATACATVGNESGAMDLIGRGNTNGHACVSDLLASREATVELQDGTPISELFAASEVSRDERMPP